MAEKAQEKPKDINLDMEHLTVKGKIHAEQYNNLRAQKIQHQVENSENPTISKNPAWQKCR